MKRIVQSLFLTILILTGCRFGSQYRLGEQVRATFGVPASVKSKFDLDQSLLDVPRAELCRVGAGRIYQDSPSVRHRGPAAFAEGPSRDRQCNSGRSSNAPWTSRSRPKTGRDI